MNYKVLYRKYRPEDFDNIVDQKFIIDTLKESIINEKLAHAYIFSGPKGTGKTSTAKVFAKAINCEHPVNGNPCCECESCKNFDLNPDIIELDAASNNKVEDIREIINNVKLTPTCSKYKVYIIDEVHMLTNSAANAFLLTLEEPPAHAIFILATTNPEELPSTILSRCQHFAFTKITRKALFDRIKYVLSNEKFDLDDTVINEIINLSDGGLRDALSILDQLLTTNKNITTDLLSEQFGVVSNDSINKLIKYILRNDIKNINDLFNNFKNFGLNSKSFIYKFVEQMSDTIYNLKNEGSEDNIDCLKNIILELSKLDYIRCSFNPYDLIKTIIFSNLKSVSVDCIESSINGEDNIYCNENIEHVECSENNISQEIIEDDKNEQSSIVVNEEIKVISHFDKIKPIRINNSFCGASKKLKSELEDIYCSYIEKFKEKHDIYSLLLDTTVGVVSETNVIIVCESSASALLLNETKDLYDYSLGNNLKLLFVDKEEWNKLTEDYKNNMKNGKIYQYIEEPIFDESSNELEKLANNIFDTSKIEIEEE